ncbi:MAG: hypothetical protein Q8Q09_09615 [Deltaproteobacteria bacterium]|nr:hypothetical protein [Deltaproteobacteria bacterium]
MTRTLSSVLAGLASLALTLRAAPAHADPSALRAPTLGPAIAFVVAAPESSRAVWLRPWLAITQEVRLPFDAFGLGVGLRRTLAGRERGWALDVQLGAGFMVPTLYPGLALTLSPSTSIRVRGDNLWFSMGLAAPAAIRLNDTRDMRLPLQGELWFAFRAGPIWLGAMTAIGAVFAPSQSAALLMQGGGYIAIPMESISSIMTHTR